MLSVASLSAFSGVVAPRVATPVRFPGVAPAGSTPAPQPPPAVPPAGNGANGEPVRVLPRGSLLDLSV